MSVYSNGSLMPNIDDIQFLEKFRADIDEYLFLGHAPMAEGLYGTTEGHKVMQVKLSESDEFRKLRQRINRTRRRAAKVLNGLGIGTIMRQYPAPAVGGPVTEHDLFGLVTNNRTLQNIGKENFIDKIDEAIGMLEDDSADVNSSDSAENAPKLEVRVGFVFIAMPMSADDPGLDDVHDTIKAVAADLNLVAERVDDSQFNERITDRIIESIETAEYVVADLTHGKPNVYWEAGLAHGLNKLPIYVAKEGTRLEFDLKDYPVIFFKNMRELRDGLRERLSGPNFNKILQ